MERAEPRAPSAQQEIRDALSGFAAALKRKDLEGVMSHYANDVVAFDIMPPLRVLGIDDYRKSWELGLSMMEGELVFELKDLDINVGGNIAFCHALHHMKADTPKGPIDTWARWTGCLEKRKGKWLITHEHFSWPIDMESNKALLDLKP